MFREKIFFDFYFFVWLVQTLTKTFFNSNNGKTFFNSNNGKTFFNSDNGKTFFNSKILLFNFIPTKKPDRKK